MDFYCEVCDKFIKPESKYKLFRSLSHKELVKCKHMESTIGKPDTDHVDLILYAYIIQQNKQHYYYLIKCHFKLIF